MTITTNNPDEQGHELRFLSKEITLGATFELTTTKLKKETYVDGLEREKLDVALPLLPFTAKARSGTYQGLKISL